MEVHYSSRTRINSGRIKQNIIELTLETLNDANNLNQIEEKKIPINTLASC
jgi:hypothetical protein